MFDGNSFEASYKEMAKSLNISIKDVKKAIKELEDNNLISVIKTRKGIICKMLPIPLA